MRTSEEEFRMLVSKIKVVLPTKSLSDEKKLCAIDDLIQNEFPFSFVKESKLEG